MTPGPAPTSGGRESDSTIRAQLSSLQGLLILSMLMTEHGDEQAIMRLVASTIPSLGAARLAGFFVHDAWSMTTGETQRRRPRDDLEAQFDQLDRTGGAVSVEAEGWGWAYSLRSLDGHSGYMVVVADAEPSADAQFLFGALSQQAGIALANARLHTRERLASAELRAANAALAESVAALERSSAIHARLTQVAAGGEGQQSIADAVHELTRHAVAIEDRHGNLRAWAGPDRPEPYPKDPAEARSEALREIQRAGRPIRVGDRVLALASPRDDVLGVLALVDPTQTAGPEDMVVLEHGATVLGMELARIRSLAETELRLGRDLVEDLLSGTDDATAITRATALGYDLQRVHRVVVVDRAEERSDGDAFFHAVRRAARDQRVGSLLAARGPTVVVLADEEPSWLQFRAAVQSEFGGGQCRVGIGSVCERPEQYPRSYREARLALKVHDATGGVNRVVDFDALGVYGLLSEVEDVVGVERLVQKWLGPLIQYDARRGSELVETLSHYLECGGNYDATATALSMHRNTLKYRLQRIRELSRLDLADADTRFNLQLATRAWHTLIAMRADDS